MLLAALPQPLQAQVADTENVPETSAPTGLSTPDTGTAASVPQPPSARDIPAERALSADSANTNEETPDPALDAGSSAGADALQEALPESPADWGAAAARALASAGFFARTPFAFDAGTPQRISQDVRSLAMDVGSMTRQMAAERPAVLGMRTLLGLLVLGLLGWLWRRHRALVKHSRRYAAEAESLERIPWEPLRGIARAAVRAAGGLAIPGLLVLASIMPVQGLAGYAPWSLGLTAGLWVLLLYRGVFVLVHEACVALCRVADSEAVRHVEQAILAATRWVLLFHVFAEVLAAAGYRADAVALARTLTLASATLLALRFLLLRGDILRILPEDGTAPWMRFRMLVRSWFPTLIGLSALLLFLWTLGFHQAASTILLRSYLLVGLFSGAAIAQRWFAGRVAEVRAEDNPLITALLREVDGFAKGCLWLLFAGAMLAVLGLLGPLLEALRTPLMLVGETPLSLHGLGKAVLFVVAGVLAARVIQVVLEQVVYPRTGMDEGAGYALTTTLRYFVILVAGLLGLVSVGFDFASLALFAGALGVGIGFGLQDIARNVVSGLILLFGRSVAKGDFVSVGDEYFGRVTEVGVRSVTILTPDRTEVVIPSSQLVNGAITNWTHSESHFRVHIPVAVSYKADPEVVRGALVEAAGRFEMIARDPAPDVWLDRFGDSAVEMTLLVWVDAARYRRDAVTGKILFEVWRVLKERGIEIPFPQRDLHLRSVPPEWRPGPPVRDGSPGHPRSAVDADAVSP